MEHGYQRTRRSCAFGAVASCTRSSGLLIGVDSREFLTRLAGEADAAKRKLTVVRRLQTRHLPEERDQRPHLVVPLQGDPSRHPRVLDAMFDDPEQLRVRPGSHGFGEVRRRRQHMRCDGAYWGSWCPMAECATAVKVTRAEADQAGVVEWRGLYADRPQLDGIAHAEGEEPLDDGPVAAAGRDIVETGPGDQESSHRQSDEGHSGAKQQFSKASKPGTRHGVIDQQKWQGRGVRASHQECSQPEPRGSPPSAHSSEGTPQSSGGQQGADPLEGLCPHDARHVRRPLRIGDGARRSEVRPAGRPTCH